MNKWHMKKFITDYKENANHNNDKISSHSSENGLY